MSNIQAGGTVVGFPFIGPTGGTRNLLFGLNMSGAEFATPNFPSAADWSYIASKGVTFVRLPVAWENLLTTVGGGTLAATYLANLKTAIAGAHAVGIGVIVDLHNFGAYTAAAQWGSTVTYAGNSGTAATGVSFLGNGITSANFANIWTLLTTALTTGGVPLPGIIGYGLMSEPSQNVVGSTNNLIVYPNGFANTIGTQNWQPGNSGTVTQLAAGTNPIAGYGPAWQLNNPASNGQITQTVNFANAQQTFSLYAKGTGSPQIYFNVAGSNIGSGTFTLTSSFQRFSDTWTPSAGSQALGITVFSGTAVTIANAQLELGASATTYNPNNYLSYAQAAITAIRAVDAATPIYVCGAVVSAAYTWPWVNWEIATLTGGNIIPEAHQYFDVAPPGVGTGQYLSTYTAFGATPTSGVTEVAPYVTWLGTVSMTGLLGELGVPNNTTDNNAAWLPLQKNVFANLRTNMVKATMWNYRNSGSDPSHTDFLNVAPQSGVDDPRLLQMLAQ